MSSCATLPVNLDVYDGVNSEIMVQIPDILEASGQFFPDILRTQNPQQLLKRLSHFFL